MPRVFKKPVYRLAGDRGLLVDFGEGIDPGVNEKVRAMARALEKQRLNGVMEMIPTYRSILFFYDPSLTDPETLCNSIEIVENTLEKNENQPVTIVEIPVCYANEFGPDIENVQKAHGLTLEEIIHLHSKPEYLIYMVGFTPGFAFLGGLDERLHTPRLATPRMLVPEGSVGIANNQTGMYPIASPGGWQIIGRTPLKLFAPHRTNPFIYKAGDKIKFKPISKPEYDLIAQQENR